MIRSVRCACVAFSAALSCFGLSAAQQGEIKGNVYEMNVEAGGTVTMNADDVAALGNGTGVVTELHKVGDGTLVAAAMSSFAGTIRISGGVYSVPGSSTAMFGTSAGKTVVEAGATILFTGTKGSTTQLFLTFSKLFELAGDGYGGMGAICVAAENNVINNRIALTNVKLTADTLVTGPKVNEGGRGGEKNSNYVYFPSGTLDMGGFTFESRCTGNIEFGSCTIVDPGHFIHSGTGQFYLNSSAKFTHGSEHKIYMRSAAALSFYNNALPNGFNWTVVCEGTESNVRTTLYFDKGPVTFGGSIEIPSGKTCYFQSSVVVTATGAITGEGSLLPCGNLYLAGDNSFEGTISGGSVYVASPTGVPDFSKCTSTINGFVLSSTPDGVGIKSDEFAAFAAGSVKSRLEDTSDKVFLVPDGGVVEIGVDINSWQGAIWNKSNGTVAFTKAVTTQRDISFLHTGTAGGFRFSNPDGDESRIGKWTLKQGRMELFDADLFKSNNTFYCQAWDTGLATHLVISNSHVYGKHFSSADKKLGPFRLGSSGSDTIEILKGSVVSNSLLLAAGNASASSALYLRDGFFGLMKNYNADCAIGETGTGYFEQSGGACEVVNHCHLGHGPGSYGLHYMSDGSFKIVAPTYNIGQSGNAVFYQNGGTFTTPSLFYIGSSAYDGSATTPKAQWIKHTWTLEGEGTKATCSADIRMSERNNTEDTVNLNDGATLSTPTIYRSRYYVDSSKGLLPDGGFYTNDNAYVNFNGGTLTGAKASFFGQSSLTISGRGTTANTPRVIVYPKGATIQLASYGNLRANIENPVGNGVTNVPMPEAAVTTGLNAPPYVNIVGDGTNATAVATFDSKTQTWTGVKVTSPGFGYTWAKARFILRGVQAYEVDCDVGDVSGGGVHFKIDYPVTAGFAQCEVMVPCTYTGPTRISGGRMWFNGGSIASRDITVDADANLCTATCINGANVHGGGDTYYNWHTASFTADGDAAGIRQASNTLTIDANPVITLKNLSGAEQRITVLRKPADGASIAGTANLKNATFVGEPVPEDFKARVSYVNGEVVVKIREIKGSLILVR